MTSRYFTDGEGTVLDRDGGSTLPEVVIECGDMALAERIAAALELHDDLTTLQDPRHSVTIEIEGPGVDGTLAFMGATPVEIIHAAAEFVRAQQEGQMP